MTMQRTFALSVAFLVLAFGCDKSTSNNGSSPTTAATASGGGGPERVRIGYFANLTHAQAVLGVASKDFDNAVAPAKVSTKVFNAGPSLIEALFANEIDVGYVGPGPALNAFAKSRGQGIRVVAGAAANGVVIVARKDSGINTLADLKGKRVATPQLGNTQDIAAKFYLSHELGQKDLNNVLPVPNAEQAAMMSGGQIDAAWAPEPWGSFLVAQAGAKVVAQEKDLWPQKNFSITVVVTTPEFLQKHPQTVEKLLGVHRTWTQRLNQEQAKYTPQLKDALYALTKKQLPTGVVESALANTTFTDEPLPHTFDVMAGWSFELGFAKEKTDVGGLIDTTILHKLSPAQGAAPAGATSAPAAGAKEGA
jgi:NitT/TauT family transport system substrate-binding protein